jgi:phage gp16-like protein
MSDLDLIYGTKPNTPPRLPAQDQPEEAPARKTAPKKASRQDSKPASTLASNQASLIETIRKTVKSLGNKVSFTRLTPEEKGRLTDLVYTYKRQGIKTSENEINRIAINFLLEDFKKNGKESVLAQVIDALNA